MVTDYFGQILNKDDQVACLVHEISGLVDGHVIGVPDFNMVHVEYQLRNNGTGSLEKFERLLFPNQVIKKPVTPV